MLKKIITGGITSSFIAILIGFSFMNWKQMNWMHKKAASDEEVQPPHQETHSLTQNQQESTHGVDHSDFSQGISAGSLVKGTAQKPNSANSHAVETVSASVESGCFIEIFHHKSIASHENGEACLHHKNLIPLTHNQINPKSICVKVNGTPVKFTSLLKQNNSIMIDAIAGPRAEVAVRLCLGKTRCKEDCKIPKAPQDEFLSAIGGDEDTHDDSAVKKRGNRKVVSWDSDADGSANPEDTALRGELNQLDRDIQGDDEKISVFKDWIQQTEIASCKEKLLTGR